MTVTDYTAEQYATLARRAQTEVVVRSRVVFGADRTWPRVHVGLLMANPVEDVHWPFVILAGYNDGDELTSHPSSRSEFEFFVSREVEKRPEFRTEIPLVAGFAEHSNTIACSLLDRLDPRLVASYGALFARIERGVIEADNQADFELKKLFQERLMDFLASLMVKK